MSDGLAIGLGVGLTAVVLILAAFAFMLKSRSHSRTESSVSMGKPTNVGKPKACVGKPAPSTSVIEQRMASRKHRARLSVTSAAGAEKLFAAYGQNADEMGREQLKQCFEDKLGLSAEVIESVLNLFSGGEGRKISKSEFEMALALLTKECSTPEQQIDACFAMFDTGGRGVLSRAEFERMLQTSVNLNLDMLLSSSTGRDSFEKQLDKEFSRENLEFWREVRNYRSRGDSLSSTERLQSARKLHTRFVADGADEMVNLPSKQQKQISAALKEARSGGTTVGPELFAEAEVRMCMDRLGPPRHYRPVHTGVSPQLGPLLRAAVLYRFLKACSLVCVSPRDVTGGDLQADGARYAPPLPRRPYSRSAVDRQFLPRGEGCGAQGAPGAARCPSRPGAAKVWSRVVSAWSVVRS